ncbi:MAG: response regulator [Cryomorphaceae bacterium]|nr:response regulator [Cryomorphaceae bacterium]
MKHSVAVADDHHIVRAGIVASINNMEGYTVTLEADNGEELIQYFKFESLPDIAIIDLHMPILDGFQTIETIAAKYPSVKTLALTVDASEDALIKAIRAGARGFIRKNARPSLFKAAIDAIITTGYFHNEDVHSTMLLNPTLKTKEERSREDVLSRITDREMQFLKLVCQKEELTYEQIADNMGITKRTVDYYRQELFEKFEIKSKVGLVLFAIEHKLL